MSTATDPSAVQPVSQLPKYHQKYHQPLQTLSAADAPIGPTSEMSLNTINFAMLMLIAALQN
jgi:hypothetical protein